jgi:hypothetical protein
VIKYVDGYRFNLIRRVPIDLREDPTHPDPAYPPQGICASDEQEPANPSQLIFEPFDITERKFFEDFMKPGLMDQIMLFCWILSYWSLYSLPFE